MKLSGWNAWEAGCHEREYRYNEPIGKKKSGYGIFTVRFSSVIVMPPLRGGSSAAMSMIAMFMLITSKSAAILFGKEYYSKHHRSVITLQLTFNHSRPRT